MFEPLDVILLLAPKTRAPVPENVIPILAAVLPVVRTCCSVGRADAGNVLDHSNPVAAEFTASHCPAVPVEPAPSLINPVASKLSVEPLILTVLVNVVKPDTVKNAGLFTVIPPPAFSTVNATPLILIAVVAVLSTASTSFKPQHVTVGGLIHCSPAPVDVRY